MPTSTSGSWAAGAASIDDQMCFGTIGTRLPTASAKVTAGFSRPKATVRSSVFFTVAMSWGRAITNGGSVWAAK